MNTHTLKKVWSKKHSLRLGENWSFGPLQFERLFGVKFPNQFIGYKEGFGSGYVDQEMLEVCYKHVIAEIYKVGFEEYFEKGAMPIFESFLSFSKTIAQNNLSDLAISDLHNLWVEFIKREDEWMNYVWMVFLLDDGLTTELKKRLKEVNLNKEDQNRFLPAMVAPSAKTAAYTLKQELLKIAQKSKEGQSTDGDLQAVADKYSYFSILNMDEAPLGVDYFKKEVDQLLAGNPTDVLRQSETDEKNIGSLYIEVKEKLSGYPDILRLIDACKKVSFYREYRNDLRQESYFYARHLYLEIAKRADISISDLIFSTREEITSILGGVNVPIDKDSISKRKTCSAIISDYKENKVWYEFETDKITNLWPKENIDTSVKEFKGISAFKGKVTGHIKIIFDVTKQAEDFKEGDILVATTTNLTFIPLIGKASAIITDEGGLLTHTAIVARELKKVAIVGSKVATKVLKDGDMVEVDAENGIVRILQ